MARLVRPTDLHILTRPLMAALLVLCLIGRPVQAQTSGVTALRFAQLVNPGEPTINDAVVVVKGDKIVSVGSGASAIRPMPRHCATA